MDKRHVKDGNRLKDACSNCNGAGISQLITTEKFVASRSFGEINAYMAMHSLPYHCTKEGHFVSHFPYVFHYFLEIKYNVILRRHVIWQ